MLRHFCVMSEYNGNIAPPVNPATTDSDSSGASFDPVTGVITSVADYLFGESRAERQHTRNREDWDAVNEYNLPENQYDRLINAGATPSAAIASLTGQNNNSSMVNPTSQSVPQSTITDALLGNAHLDIDRSLAMAEIDKKRAEAAMFESVTNRNNTLTPKEANKLDAEFVNIVKMSQLNDAQKRQVDYFTDRAKRFEQKEMEKLRAEIHRIQSEAANLDWDAYFKYRYGDELNMSEIRKNNAQAYYSTMSGNLARNEAVNEKIKGDILKCERFIAEFDSWYVEVFGAKPDADTQKQFFTAYNVDRYNKEDRKDSAPNRMIRGVEYYLDEGINVINEVGQKHPKLRNYLYAKEGSHFLQDWIDSASNYMRGVGSWMHSK